jgi:hypothetical protein
MDLLQTLLVSEIVPDTWNELPMEEYMRKKYPTLQQAWDQLEEARTQYSTLMSIFRLSEIGSDNVKK